jgi:HK97 family phage prohead protease
MSRKFYPCAPAAVLGDRQIRVMASTQSPDRADDVMVPAACRLDGYRKNPIVLWQHDGSQPVGTADVSIVAGGLAAVITFAAKGLSAIADMACALYKSRVLRAISIGFNPLDWEPRGSKGGLKYTSWELLEISCVSVPCNENALTIERQATRPSTKYQIWTPPAALSLRQLAARTADPAEFAFYKRLELEQDACRAAAAIDSPYLAKLNRPKSTRAARLAVVEALKYGS